MTEWDDADASNEDKHARAEDRSALALREKILIVLQSGAR